MAAMDEKPPPQPPAAPSAEESRRLVSEFFVKSLNVILGARIPSKYLHNPSTSSSSPSPWSSSKSFNLVLVNSPMRNKCHLSVVEPIVVDVLLLHHGSNACSGKDHHLLHWNPNPNPNPNPSQQQSQQSLLERWIVHCELKNNNEKKIVPESAKNTKSKNSAARKPPLSKKSSINPWKKVVKMLTVMLRSLYSLTRLLPAYKIFQQLNCSSGSRGSSPECCHFDLSYRVRSSLFANGASSGGFDRSLCKFDLAPVETELGRMCISVRYSDAASVEKAIQRTSSIFSKIIPDYVRADPAAGNPHFAVADKRISAATRTMSSNIPAAKVAAATASIRRSYSSPLDQNDLEKHHQQQQQQELVCPFACDDEQKLSRDAATGSLVAALLSAAPLEGLDHRRKICSPSTLGEALGELQNYRDIARRKL